MTFKTETKCSPCQERTSTKRFKLPFTGPKLDYRTFTSKGHIADYMCNAQALEYWKAQMNPIPKYLDTKGSADSGWFIYLRETNKWIRYTGDDKQGSINSRYGPTTEFGTYKYWENYEKEQNGY